MMSHLKSKAFLLMAVVFLLGVIAGASLTTLVSRKFAAPSEVSHRHDRQKILEKFKSRLKLSPDQTGQIEVIFEDAHKQFGALHQTVKPQFEEIRSRIRSRIREILNEEQKKEFEVMNREYDERRAKDRPH